MNLHLFIDEMWFNNCVQMKIRLKTDGKLGVKSFFVKHVFNFKR